MDTMVQDSQAGALQASFIAAREASQRVHQDVVRKDTKLITTFTDSVAEFTDLLQIWQGMLRNSQDLSGNLYINVSARHDFHLKMGFKEMERVVKQEFVRGWELAEERGVSSVAHNVYDVLNSFDHFLQYANRSSLTTSARETAWFSVENALQSRKMLALGSMASIKETYTAFDEAKPLLNYPPTIDERYDASYATLSVLLGSELRAVDDYYNGMTKSLRSFVDGLDALVSLGQSFVNDSVLDTDALARCKVQIREAASQFSYELLRFSDRVVKGSLVRVKQESDEFEATWVKLNTAADAVLVTLTDTEAMVRGMLGFWPSVQAVARQAKRYLEEPLQRKTQLAHIITTQLGSVTDAAKIYVREIRSKVRTLAEHVLHYKTAWMWFWKELSYDSSREGPFVLGYGTLRKFYALVHEDFEKFLNAEAEEEKVKLANVLHALIKNQDYVYPRIHSPDDVLNLTKTDLWFRLNLDSYVMNIVEIFRLVDTTIRHFTEESDMLQPLGDKDQTFLKAANAVINDMEAFLEGNEIDTEFYR